MPFDHLLEYATSAADAAEAARIMAVATVDDEGATERERADARAILDLSWDELVDRFAAPGSGSAPAESSKEVVVPLLLRRARFDRRVDREVQEIAAATYLERLRIEAETAAAVHSLSVAETVVAGDLLKARLMRSGVRSELAEELMVEFFEQARKRREHPGSDAPWPAKG